MFGLGSLGTKIAAGAAAVGVALLALLRIISGAKKSERNRIEKASLKKELEITKDAQKEREDVRIAGPDAARKRMHQRRRGGDG